MDWKNLEDKPQSNDKQSLIQGSIKLASKIANEHRQFNESDNEDLQSAAFLGLVEAAEKFDPARGIAFSTYAAYWIRACVYKYIIDNFSMVKIGTTIQQRTLFFRLRREQRKLEKAGCEVTNDAVADAIGTVNAQDVAEMDHRLSTAAVSLNDSVDSEDGPSKCLLKALATTDPSPADCVEAKHDSEVFNACIIRFEQTLDAKESSVWQKAIMAGNCHVAASLVQDLGLTRQRVNQIKLDLEKRFVRFARQDM